MAFGRNRKASGDAAADSAPKEPFASPATGTGSEAAAEPSNGTGNSRRVTYSPAKIVSKGARAPTPPASPDDHVARLEREIQSLKQTLHDSARSRDQSSKEMNKVLEAFEGLGDLSEILSMRYNPFLDGKEANIFDGLEKNKAKLLEGFLSPTGVAGDEAKPGEPAEGVLSEEKPVELGARLFDKGTTQPLTTEPEPLAAPEPAPPLPPPVILTTPPPSRRSHLATPRGERTIGGARETYMALCWMHSIQDVIDPQAIHPILEHYRRIEWIDQDVYDWMCGLADGIVERGDGGWDLFDLEPKKRSKLHAANVAFFDDLFRNHLRPEERDVLERDVAAYFRGL